MQPGPLPAYPYDALQSPPADSSSLLSDGPPSTSGPVHLGDLIPSASSNELVKLGPHGEF